MRWHQRRVAFGWLDTPHETSGPFGLEAIKDCNVPVQETSKWKSGKLNTGMSPNLVGQDKLRVSSRLFGAKAFKSCKCVGWADVSKENLIKKDADIKRTFAKPDTLFVSNAHSEA
jgi:hypothetical protein